ncbi:MAG: DUF4190 domain-containing protein [Candidatus Dormibacteraeota bacterium]|nr:DUF4190 domain-containing protein [Candidatus Dormibacteraeota bacterium]
MVSQTPPTPPGETPAVEDPNWSADELEEPYGDRATSPPSGQTWDPGPALGYETPGYQPLIDDSRPATTYPPPLGLQMVALPPVNGMAVASLVLSLVGWTMVPVLASILAVIFGHVARRQMESTGQRGGGMAVAGLVLGYINLALWLIGILVAIVIVIAIASAASSAGG